MFLKLLLFEFCSPTPALSPAEIEEELKVLQDVPSLLSQYVEAEPAGKKKGKWGRRAEGGVRMILVGSNSMHLLLLVCARHEGQGQEPSLSKVRAGLTQGCSRR